MDATKADQMAFYWVDTLAGWWARPMDEHWAAPWAALSDMMRVDCWDGSTDESMVDSMVRHWAAH